MADIFISYSREDRRRVDPLVKALRRHGYSVWWDRDLAGGSRYLEETEAELKAAKAVLVVWTKTSVASHWVADEAGAARDMRKLVPVSLDGIMPPLGFRQFQVIDFADWKPANAARLAELTAAIARLVSPPGAASSTNEPPPARQPTRRRTMVIGGLAAACVAIAATAGAVALFGARPQQATASSSNQVAFFGFTAGLDGPLATIAATANDETVTTLTAMHLSTVAPGETVGTSPVERLNRAKALGARYAISGDIQADGPTITISVRLEHVPSRTALWSETLKGSGDEPLGVQAAALATDTLACFIERAEGLSDRIVELGALIARACRDLRSPSLDTLPVARELALKAPGSATINGTLGLTILLVLDAAPEAAKPGLVAEAESATRLGLKLDPGNSYSNLANYQLSVAKREPLVSRERALLAGLKTKPSDPTLNNFYGVFLRGVGLTEQAFPHLSLAVAGDPLSAPKRTGYATALAFAGRKADAEEQFGIASRLVSASTPLWHYRMRSALLGDVGDVASLLAHPPASTPSESVQCWRDIAAGLASRNNASRLRAANRARACTDRGALPSEATYGAVSLLGDVDSALVLAARPVQGSLVQAGHFTPQAAAMRADPRFLSLVENNGVLAYWKATGARPDFCKIEDVLVCAALREAGTQR